MKRVICVCLMMMFMFATVSFAADGRWIPIDEDGLYVDSKTATYDADTNSIYFWTKYEQNSELINMDYHHVELNAAKECIVKGAFYQNQLYPKVRVYDDNPNVDIWPDDAMEKAANIVCDMYGIAHMYPDTANRWKWLYSTNKRTTNYAPSMVRVDKGKNTVIVWTQGVLPDGTYTPSTKCTCYFDDNTIEYINSRGVLKQYVLPDTLEEAIFDVARTYLQNDVADFKK